MLTRIMNTRPMRLPLRLYRLFLIRFIFSTEGLEQAVDLLTFSTSKVAQEKETIYFRLAMERELLRREMKGL